MAGLITFSGSLRSQSPVTITSLLREMTDFETPARWPKIAYTLKQASSYDRRSVSPGKPGWFANGDFNQFIRSEQNNGRIEHVMMDVDGPGVIVRFWLTTLLKKGVMRFYLDKEKNPSITIPAYDLMQWEFKLGRALLNPHTSYTPDGKGGNTLYLPIPYQQHCKITWENVDSSTIDKPHYYQINYRTYPANTRVKTFDIKDLSAAKTLIDKTEKELWQPQDLKHGMQTTITKQVVAGGVTEMELPSGPAAIRLLTIKLSVDDSAKYENAWRTTILKIEFEGKQTVYCPLGDFAGSGYGAKPVKSWYRELTSSGTLKTRWVMPYKQEAKISIINKADYAIDIDVNVIVSKWKWDASCLYFHAINKEEKHVKDKKWDYDVTKVAREDTAAPVEWNLVSVKGKGIYMGNTLAVYNHMQSWYGEGDAKLYVDGEHFPSEFGTGLEDYYNTSWAPVVLYQTPFANAPRADQESSFGHNTFTRTRNLDAVPFASSFKYDLEMLSWHGGVVDISATTYWYGSLF
jgi:hypothetical protein